MIHHFIVKNTTDSQVSISNIRVSCGCVSATAIKNTLQPKEETAIVARMDTTRFNGSKSVTIYVIFDRPRYEEVRLQVQAYGRNDFAVSPESFNFLQVKQGTTAEATVQIRFYGFPNAQITEAKTESNFIKVTTKEIKREGNEVTFQATARVREDIPVGKWFSEVWIKGNSASIGQIRIPLNIEVEAPLTLTPATLSLGEPKMGEAVEKKVIVRGAVPFKIVGLDGLNDQWQVKEIPGDKKEVHVLTVTFKPAKEGEARHKLTIRTDLGAGGSIDLSASAKVVP